MIAAIILGYLAILWIGWGVYIARRYRLQYRAVPAIRWQLPLMLAQGAIWIFGIYLFGRSILKYLS